MDTCTTPNASNEGVDANSHGWPTTQRFSRRLGAAHRGADYARAIELADDHPVMNLSAATLRLLAASILTALAAAIVVLYAGG